MKSLLGIVTVAVASAVTPALATQYTIQTINPPDGVSSSIGGISDNGLIVGAYQPGIGQGLVGFIYMALHTPL